MSSIKKELCLLQSKSSVFGIELNDRQIDLASIYIKELLAWNKHMNITGLSTYNEVINELFFDSILPGPSLPDTGKMLDVGSGGGFPAIPLKILKPKTAVDLLEPISKRCSFLKHVIRSLKLKDIRVIKGRIENDKNQLSFEGYDIITSRALASIDHVIEWCSPYLAKNGMLVSYLGNDAEKDLKTQKNFKLIIV